MISECRTPVRVRTTLRTTLAACLLALTCGCSALNPSGEPPPAFFSLNRPANAAARPAAQTPTAGATIIVSPTGAAAGFDSPRIIYLRKDHELEYFAHNQWIDPPARMLGPLIAAALEGSGAFRAVVNAPSSASADLRLDTEIVMLQHEFTQKPSRVRFILRAVLVETMARRVLATREFEALAAAPSDDPYGGVVAANQAVASVLEELAVFCAGVKLPPR